MTFALFLCLARSCDSFKCFLRSHLFFFKEASVLGDLFMMLFVNLFESPSSFSVFRCPYFFLVRGSFSCVFCFSQGASLSRSAWSGALLTQDEALSRVDLAVTLGVALPAILFISVSLSRSGRDAEFSLFYSFNFFFSRLLWHTNDFSGNQRLLFFFDEMTLKNAFWNHCIFALVQS